MGLALEAKRYQSAAWHGAVPYSVHPPRAVQTISFLFIRFMLSACRESQAKGIEKQKSGISCLRLSHSCSSPLTPAILCIHRLADPTQEAHCRESGFLRAEPGFHGAEFSA